MKLWRVELEKVQRCTAIVQASTREAAEKEALKLDLGGKFHFNYYSDGASVDCVEQLTSLVECEPDEPDSGVDNDPAHRTVEEWLDAHQAAVGKEG